jgi:SAM-dependent methyltransferase
MNFEWYQTIPELDIEGRMNTPGEFEKIGLPKSMPDWEVLDIGCNTGAFLIECYKRGASRLCGVEPNKMWRTLAQGVWWEYERYCVAPNKFHEVDYMIFENFNEAYTTGGGYNLVLLLSVTHVCEGISSQELLDKALELTTGLLILEVNDRLQTEQLVLPDNAVLFGKNKDDRSVYHIWNELG